MQARRQPAQPLPSRRSVATSLTGQTRVRISCCSIFLCASPFIDHTCDTTGYHYFYAVDAFDCLSSVPFVADVALRFIEYYNTTMQFQSTLAYLRDPPADYQQPAVDFFQVLEQIKANVTAGAYVNQYAFESELMHLVYSTHDSHVQLYAGALSTFTFGNDYPLVSASLDGKEAPKVYLAGKYSVFLAVSEYRGPVSY